MKEISQNLIVHKSLEKVVIASSKQAIKNSITIKLQKQRKTKDYIKTMLVECKSWSGPCASVDELQLILRQNPD